MSQITRKEEQKLLNQTVCKQESFIIASNE